MLTRAEALLASATATLALAILVAYVPYRIGWRVYPLPVLAATLAGAIAFSRTLLRVAAPNRTNTIGLAVVLAATATFFLVIALPELLPIGGGPDLAHHLVLINHIDRAWKLTDDPALYPYLGDMMDYTPGAHLLMALAAASTRSGALRVVHPVLVLTIALKAGTVFSIARRLAHRETTATAAGFAAVLLLFVPYSYFGGSFVVHSFWPQVVAELFACAAWWMAVLLREDRSLRIIGLFALFGMAVFVTWPIWIGPIVLAFAGAVALNRSVEVQVRWRDAASGLVPIGIIAVFHSAGRIGRLQMAATSGYAIQPSPSTLGWLFIVVAAVGVVAAVTMPRVRIALVFATAIALQGVFLYVVAHRRGADTPYLALKMMYLGIYPLSVAGAVAMTARSGLAWIFTITLLPIAAQRVLATPQPKPIVTLSAWRAGLWARDHLDRACVDYLVADGYTGYWLHLAVLDNPRGTSRFNDPNTFDSAKAIERWVEVNGLPYAIVDDVGGFSKALFNGTDTLARFDPSIVIKRRGGAQCPAQ